MASPASEWQDPRCAFRVEWVPEKLDQIRIATVEAFYSLPRGGLEIGGILLGSFEGTLLRINDWTVIECEHLTGPSFALSPRDEAMLQSQLVALGNKPVGWFHSHTRSEISFSEQDLQVHNKFFPKAWQVGMVLRPANLQPVRANYFFRDRSRSIVPGGNEFVVEVASNPEPEVRPKRAPVLPIASAPAPKPAAKAPTPAPVAPHKPAPEPVAAPRLTRPASRPARRFALWPLAVLLPLALAAGAYVTRDSWMPKQPEPLKLQASELDGKLLIRWTPLREGKAGQLQITDGGNPTDIPLDAAQMSQGAYLYTRKAVNETVRLTVGSQQETTHFVGPLPPPAAPPAEAQAEEAAAKETKAKPTRSRARRRSWRRK